MPLRISCHAPNHEPPNSPPFPGSSCRSAAYRARCSVSIRDETAKFYSRARSTRSRTVPRRPHRIREVDDCRAKKGLLFESVLCVTCCHRRRSMPSASIPDGNFCRISSAVDRACGHWRARGIRHGELLVGPSFSGVRGGLR